MLLAREGRGIISDCYSSVWSEYKGDLLRMHIIEGAECSYIYIHRQREGSVSDLDLLSDFLKVCSGRLGCGGY